MSPSPMKSEVLPVWRSPLLADVRGIVHGITQRVPGLGRADGNVGYSPPRDQADAWAMRRRWAAVVGVDPDRIVTVGQVHGRAVLRARAADAGLGARPSSGRLGLADAIVCGEPGPVLFSLHADCLPLLLAAPGTRGRQPVVAAVHAGWRGTVADIAGETVRAMADGYDVDPADLVAATGPTIGGCCYEVGPEVVAAWSALAGADAGAALRARADRTALDLDAANRLLLVRAGVRPDRIESAGICTRCHGASWFSHRGQGPTTGRFAAVIAIAD